MNHSIYFILFILKEEHRNKDIELKANWSRTKKEEGFRATNIKIESRSKNPIVDVDPFGPPVLNVSDQRIASLKLALPSTESEIKYIKPAPKEPEDEKITKTNVQAKTSSILKKSYSDTTEYKSKSKRDKSSSVSPKRVQISNGINSKSYSNSDSDEESEKNFKRTNFDMVD